jgi:N-sulfoglucosamine sulfohydrolase
MHIARLPLLVLLALTASGPAGRGTSAAPAQPARPNILFAFADDLGRHAGIYAAIDGPGTANDLLRTPHIDRVGREGVVFRRAFVSAPSCTPSRSALLSGQHFWRTGQGAILRGARWDDAIPSFPLMLREAGYHIGKSYKVWSPGEPVDAPHGRQQHAYEAAGRRFGQFSQHVTDMVSRGQRVADAKAVLYDEVRRNFDAFLANRRPGQPFSFWFGPVNVHRQWIRGSGRALWGLNPDELEGRMPAALPDVSDIREDLADYFGEVMAFDAALGVLVERLEAIGELDNTIVVVSGDHGAPGFPHGKCNLYDFGTAVPLVVRWGAAPRGRVVDDLVSLPDLAPTFLEAAGLEVPAHMTGRSLLGILTSSRSGIVEPARDAVFTGRERHVENAREGYLPYPQRAIRTLDHLYIINFEPDRWPMGDPRDITADSAPEWSALAQNTRATLADEDAGPTKAWMVAHRNDPRWRPYYERAYGKRPREELYVLADDPHQLRNVATDPAHAAVRERLHARLMSELETTGDPRVVDGGRYFETAPLAGPLP